MKRNFFILAASFLMAVCCLFTGCAGGAKPEDRTNETTAVLEEHQSEDRTGDESTVVLTERQKEILKSEGLPEEYDELTLLQKNAIESIEDMLSYLEKTYGKTFCYLGYVAAGGADQEHLTAYPADGSPSDIVTVYRTYSDGAYTYSDDYPDILAYPLYMEKMQEYFNGVLGEEGYKLFLDIVDTDGDCNAGNVLVCASASSTILIDSAVCTEDGMEQIVSAYGDWIKEQSNSKQSSTVEFFLVESAEFSAMNAYNYSDKIMAGGSIKAKVCSVSQSGSINIY